MSKSQMQWLLDAGDTALSSIAQSASFTLLDDAENVVQFKVVVKRCLVSWNFQFSSLVLPAGAQRWAAGLLYADQDVPLAQLNPASTEASDRRWLWWYGIPLKGGLTYSGQLPAFVHDPAAHHWDVQVQRGNGVMLKKDASLRLIHGLSATPTSGTLNVTWVSRTLYSAG